MSIRSTIRKINAPEGKAAAGPPGPAAQGGMRTTSAFMREALDKGAELFDWNARKAQSGQRIGSKVRGVGVAMSTFFAGSSGFDGLLVIKPDGRLYVQSGIGNFGTESVIDVHRVSAEILGVPWDQVEVTWGNTARNLPWTCISGGSQTTHAMTRAAHAAGMDAKRKLQEIAAKTLGGNAASYEVTGGRVSGGGRSMTLAQAAQKAIELGGKFDGHEVPEDVNALHEAVGGGARRPGADGRGARQLSGRSASRSRSSPALPKWKSTSRRASMCCSSTSAIVDVGTILHPRNLGGQILGRSMLGIGHAIGQKWVYDQHYGVALAKRFYQNKPPTILDAPRAHAVGRARHSRSGHAGRLEGHRRAAGRRGLLRGAERAQRRARRQRDPPGAGVARHDPHVARGRAAGLRDADGGYLESDVKH